MKEKIFAWIGLFVMAVGIIFLFFAAFNTTPDFQGLLYTGIFMVAIGPIFAFAMIYFYRKVHEDDYLKNNTEKKDRFTMGAFADPKKKDVIKDITSDEKNNK